jgi:2-polyprenyl-3-methyl-5-hydroxy-6-metoxy-1,4-benzoquinol methylase
MKKDSLNHGSDTFDPIYFGRVLNKYDKDEFDRLKNMWIGIFKYIRKYLPQDNGHKVLEVGCQFGAFSSVLKENGYEVMATDISSFILKKAKKINPRIKFVKLDLDKKIELKDRFDIIFAFEVLEHLESPEFALKELYKRLNKGGILIFSTPLVNKLALSDPTHINVHEPEWWLKTCKKIGLKKIQHTNILVVPFFYKFGSFFSVVLPILIYIPFLYISSTGFYVFTKD